MFSVFKNLHPVYIFIILVISVKEVKQRVCVCFGGHERRSRLHISQMQLFEPCLGNTSLQELFYIPYKVLEDIAISFINLASYLNMLRLSFPFRM